MKINLEELKYQKDALNSIINVFPKLDFHSLKDENGISSSSIFANPIITDAGNENKFIDVKMETGTGKTYVYTRMMYELNKKYGMSKFIVIVPSLAIKEGAKNFITSKSAKQHFSQFFPNKNLRLYQISSGDFAKRNGRYNISNDLLQFTKAMTNDKNTINVLLMSDKGFLDRKSSSLFKDQYDINLINSSMTPAESIMMTRPIVIIDEPHRFKRNGNSYINILNKFKPEIIVRFGATFPKKENSNEIDYYRKSGPVYNLNSIESFNKGLVKGVDIIYPYMSTPDSLKYKVKDLTNKSVSFKQDSKLFKVNVGESLSEAFSDNNFDGNITYYGKKHLSNDLKLEKGMTLLSGTFNNSYQEIMIKQLIDEHFNKEQENFFRDGYKIKTISLIFIDDISSYRDKNGWLKNKFESILNKKLNVLIEKYTLKDGERDKEYLDFLKTTKKELNVKKQKVHGGYFAQDWGESDESAAAEERDDILHKERTIPFKNGEGKWNTRRFFFSKWTLREGWDNPNVFVIAKLRSSGSENSKIQEVGRGLRLPVDEKGNRISNEDFYLSYIIGYDEKNFAEKLVGEINSDTDYKVKIGKPLDDSIINKLLSIGTYGKHKGELYNKLINDKIIDYDYLVIDGKKLNEILPKIRQNKVRNRPNGVKKSNMIKLNKNNWSKIKNMWVELSKRYMIKYEDFSDEKWLNLINDILNNKDKPIMQLKYYKTSHNKLGNSNSDDMSINNYNETDYNKYVEQMDYGSFITQISKRTNIPLRLINKSFANYLPLFCKKELINNEELKNYFNEETVSYFVKIFDQKFSEKFATKYHYNQLNFYTDSSVWDAKKENFKDSVNENLIGENESYEENVNKKISLYDENNKIRFDSKYPELAILKEKCNPEITVFGKIPKSSIRIPKYTGGTTTPDFIYSINNDMYLLIEAKSENKRTSDKLIVSIQNKFFDDKLNEKVNYKEATSVNDVIQELKKLDHGK